MRKITVPVLIALISTQAVGADLSLVDALEGARTALKNCERSGYHVTVTVVDDAGLPIVVLKGDGATPHTLDTARGKAYTVMTLGPLFGESTTSRIAEKVRANPASTPLEDVPGILLLAGGAAVTFDGDVIAGIGVGGAPGGLLDEACALAGVEAIMRSKK